MSSRTTRVVPISLLAVAAILTSFQQPQETEVGPQALLDAFDFVGGFPTEESVQLAFDQLDFQRAAQVYLEFMPAMSTQSIFESMIRDNGLTSPGDVGVYVQPGEGKSEVLGLTYNTESIYASAEIDLHADGPTVVEVPPEVLGVVDDGWQRYITDLGNAGPDRGQGVDT